MHKKSPLEDKAECNLRLTMTLKLDKVSGLYLPPHLIEEKASLKRVLDEWLQKVVGEYQFLRVPYFLTFHAKFNTEDPMEFMIDAPKITKKLPPFISNSFVWWVDNKRSFYELLWMVPPKKKGHKLQPEFNTSGVAYLQAKGAMPS